MSSIGVWPNSDGEQHWLFRYYFIIPLCFVVFMFIIPQTTMAITVRSDFEKLLEVLNLVMMMNIISIFKLLAMRYNKKGIDFSYEHIATIH